MNKAQHMPKLYDLPKTIYTLDEQIRSGGDNSYALQAECSKTTYGVQMAAELVKRYNAHEDMLMALKGLLADIEEYQNINNLGGESNHWQVAARKAYAKAEGK